MIYWLIATIFAYLLFAFSSLGDKLVLDGKPKPNSYTFYVSLFSIFILLLLPFTKIGFPSATGLIFIVLYAVIHILGLYTMFTALEKFDVSKVIPTIGATQPIFIFILTWIFFGTQTILSTNMLALLFLFAGSVIISIEKNLKITRDYLKITIFSSLMFSFEYILAKMVFINLTFLPGIIWTGIFLAFFSLFFLFSKKARKEIFSKKIVSNKKTQTLFFSAQLVGGVGGFMQGLAISLAPIAFLATVNSLKGIQYVAIFIATLFISIFYPKVLKEAVSKKVIFQKVISILLIVTGLALLVY